MCLYNSISGFATSLAVMLKWRLPEIWIGTDILNPSFIRHFLQRFSLGGGAKFAPPPVFGPNRAQTKKNIKEHLKLRLFWANFALSIPLKNISKYPKLAFQKSQLNILQKIEKLVKIEKNVKLAYKILKWKIVWWFL